MSDFQEFPKLLYLGGDINAVYVVVKDEAEEAAAEGYSIASFEPVFESVDPQESGTVEEVMPEPSAPQPEVVSEVVIQSAQQVKKRGRPAKAQ